MHHRRTTLLAVTPIVAAALLLSACNSNTDPTNPSSSASSSATGETAPPDVTRIIFPNDKQPVSIPADVPSPVLPEDFAFADKPWKVSVEPASAAEIINPSVPAADDKEGFLVPNIVPTGEVQEFTVVVEQSGSDPIKVKVQLIP